MLKVDSKKIANTPKTDLVNNLNNVPGIKSFLQSLRKQAKNLSLVIETVFSQVKNNTEAYYVNTNLKELQQEITKTAKKLPKKIKNSDSASLSAIKKQSENNIKYFNEKSKSSQIEENKMQQKHALFKDFSENMSLFEKIDKQLNLIYEEIQQFNPETDETEEKITQVYDDFLCRIKKIAPGQIIPEEIKLSFQKDIQRLKKYKMLKSNWSESLQKYQLLIAQSALEIIKSYSTALNTQEKAFEALKSEFFNLSAAKIAEGYHEDYEEKRNTGDGEKVFFKRSLEQIDEQLKSYDDKFKNFYEQHEIITSLVESTKAFLPNVETLLIKMSWAIASLSEQKGKTKNVEENPHPHQDEIQALSDLQKNIEIKWNDFFLRIKELNPQIEKVKKYDEINREMVLCYVLAETIHGEIRHARKTEGFKTVHDKNFTLQLAKFNLLEQWYESIKVKIEKIKNEDKDILKSSNFFSGDQKISMLRQIIKLDFIDVTKGLVWISENANSEIIKTFKEQEIALKIELNKYEKNISESYNVLHQMCELALVEINQEKKTITKVEANGTDYTETFTEAYPTQNYYLQGLKWLAKAVVRNTVSLIGYDVLPEADKIKDSFDKK
jgi:hypothetical protein